MDKGLGDTIARATAAVGIKPCGGCKKRAEYLNATFTYAQWWEKVQAGNLVTNFQSEEIALQFLAAGKENLPKDMQSIYEALQLRKEKERA